MTNNREDAIRDQAFAEEALAIQAIARTQGFKVLVAGVDQRLKQTRLVQVPLDDPNYGIKSAHRDGQIAALTSVLNSLGRALEFKPSESPPAEAQ